MVEAPQSSWQRWSSRIRWLAAGIAGCVFAIFLLQNLEPVEFRLLFVVVALPRAIVLFAVALLGFILGVLWSLSKR